MRNFNYVVNVAIDWAKRMNICYILNTYMAGGNENQSIQSSYIGKVIQVSVQDILNGNSIFRKFIGTIRCELHWSSESCDGNDSSKHLISNS